MQLQRTAKGWRSLSALDENQAPQQIWVDGDKNKSMVRTEVLTKKLAAIFQRQHIGRPFMARRSEGKVFSEWIPVVRVNVDTPDACEISWNMKYANELQIDRAAIELAFKEIAREPADVQWG